MKTEKNVPTGQQFSDENYFNTLPKSIAILKILEGLTYFDAKSILDRVSIGLIVNSTISYQSDQF